MITHTTPYAKNCHFSHFAKTEKMNQTRKCGNCECIATWGPRRRASRLGCLDQFCTADAHKLLSCSFKSKLIKN